MDTYEKKYKEAQKWIESIYPNLSHEQQMEAEAFFPELAEPEDEKVRKEIIAHCRNTRCVTEEGAERIAKWIAWLEKQGGQKVSVVEFNAKDWYVSKVDGKIYNAKFMKKNSTNLSRKLEIEKAAMSATGIIDREEWFIKGAKWADENPAYISSEKQGEKKPTDKVEPKFKVGDRITKSSKKSCPVHSSIDDTICEVTEVHDTCYILNTKEGRIQEPFEWQDYYELVEPAWSEEDEVMIKVFDSIIRYIVEVVDKDALERFGTNREELFSWLKSLRSQSKQEWSEDDERNLNDAILFIETGTYSLDKDNLINWLKSLRPQNRDTYNPYKEVVSSIAEMCDKYKSFSDDRANDFVNNVKVKCKDAKEYDSIYPQNTWLPSDEQMESLEQFISEYKDIDDSNRAYPISHIIESLYNDLKKLKGE